MLSLNGIAHNITRYKKKIQGFSFNCLYDSTTLSNNRIQMSKIFSGLHNEISNEAAWLVVQNYNTLMKISA